MVRPGKRLIFGISLCLVACFAAIERHYHLSAPKECRVINESVSIDPDYSGAALPPNIAPCNFTIGKPGRGFAVFMRGKDGTAVRILSRSPSISIPAGQWRKLLAANRGGALDVTISVLDDSGAWNAYHPVTIAVAREPIDRYLVNRIIKPIYVRWEDVGIWQRDLESFEWREIFNGRTFGNGCLNCHTFLNNNPDRMIVGTRSKRYKSAAILATPEGAVKLNTKFGYASWHPSGKFIAFADMDVYQFIHSARQEFRDVIDMRSCIALFDGATQKVTKKTDIMGPHVLETYPCWTPDGKTLYFCSAPVLWNDPDKIPPENYAHVKYSICKVGYDVATGVWGRPDTVVSAKKTGLSAVLPRISPNGRFLLFCMCDYGVFPIYQKSSDLYLLNLSTGVYRRLDINSDESESWHCWSSNSRWIAFSSRRHDGEFTRTYISYVDTNGGVRKPFIVPQKDPAFYTTFLKTFSVPELITGPVHVSERALGAAAQGKPTRSATAVPNTAKPRGMY
jgi:hypothetical protein